MHLLLKIFPGFAMIFSLHANSQFIWSTDSLTPRDPNYGMGRYHETLRHGDPIMYLVFPVIEPIEERRVPLQDGEGKDGYWVEGHFGHRFTIYKGKYYELPAFQRLRITLDVSMLSMLTRDESSPILPFNIKIGPGIDYLLSSLNSLKKENSTMLWLSAQFHHYSNGQADSFFLEAPVKRNNYRSGNFSTNYIRGLLHFAVNRRNLLITSLGFQQHVDVGGPIGSSTELKNYFGDGRLLFQLNWIKKPWLMTRHIVDRSKPTGSTIDKDIRRQLGIRTELEYITGSLSEWPLENKYRLGWHVYFTYMPSVTNEVGFIAHTYVGRHYLNMRFDDVVFAGGVGIMVKFNGN